METSEIINILTGNDTKYSQEQLDQAFELVKPDTHWKAPVDALIEAGQVDIVTIAIVHFTGCVPNMEPEGNKVRVTSVGYWVAMGEE
jgi:hypothetical protein